MRRPVFVLPGRCGNRQSAAVIERLVTHDIPLHQPRLFIIEICATIVRRGADAMYVATARSSQATLLTLDAELQAPGRPLASISTPAEWLARFG